MECADGSYYTGSTNNLERRLQQHQNGEGANYTKKHLPVKLVYFEEFQSIAEAFYREKQVQGWSRKKKEALINGCFDKLSSLSKNYTQYPRKESVISTGSITEKNDAVSELAEDTAKKTNSPSTSSGDATGSITEEKTSSITEKNDAVSELAEDTATNTVSPSTSSGGATNSITEEKTGSITDKNDAVSELAEDTVTNTGSPSTSSGDATGSITEEKTSSITDKNDAVSELVEDTAKTEQP